MWPTLNTTSFWLPQGGVFSQLSWSVLQETTKDRDERTPGRQGTGSFEHTWTSHRFLWQQFQELVASSDGIQMACRKPDSDPSHLSKSLKLWEDSGLGILTWDDSDHPEVQVPWNIMKPTHRSMRSYPVSLPGATHHTRNMKDQLCEKFFLSTIALLCIYLNHLTMPSVNTNQR